MKYVGSGACEPCHQEISKKFSRHGMARTFKPMSEQNEIADWGGTQIVKDHATGYHYQPIRKNGRYFIKEFRLGEKLTLDHELWREIHYTIGSGTHDRGYLHEDEGYLYMMPLEWYRKSNSWNFAPAFEIENRRFSRTITPRCIGCHSDYPQPISLFGGRFQLPLPEGISCERCHGPGELHIQTRQASQEPKDTLIDPTIVNPIHLSTARQLDICAQCHMQGDVEILHRGRREFDFRPGERLADHREVFVAGKDPDNQVGFVRHLERLTRSNCFIGSSQSKKAMSCTTCHDPHSSSTNLPHAYWNQKCLNCHHMEELSLAHTQRQLDTPETENCVRCHMQISEPVDLRHVTIHDHWIRRWVEEPNRNVTPRYAPGPNVKLVPFTWPDGTNESLEIQALAYAELKIMDRAQEVLLKAIAIKTPRPLLQQKKSSLHQAIQYLSDPRSQLLAARLLWSTGKSSAALEIVNKILITTPLDTQALILRTALLADKGAGNQALKDARQAVSIDPSDPILLMTLARVEATHGSQKAALESYSQVLKRFSYSTIAMTRLGEILLGRGENEGARRLYQQAVNEMPLDPRAHFGVGVALNRLKATSAAENSYRKAIALDSNFSEAYFNLANLLALREPAEAESAYRAALLARPNYVEAQGNLAFLLLQQGHKEKAIQAFERVLELRPQDKIALDMLQRLNQARK